MITIDDHGSFARVGKAVKTQADKLQGDLSSSTVKAADEVKQNVKKSAATILPKRGGLAAAVARLEIRAERTTKGCRIQANSPYNIARMNDGSVSHPVYGNPRTSVSQSITPGFWDRAVKDSEPAIQREVQRAMDETKAQIERKG